MFQNPLVFTVKDNSFTQIYSRENYNTFTAKLQYLNRQKCHRSCCNCLALHTTFEHFVRHFVSSFRRSLVSREAYRLSYKLVEKALFTVNYEKFMTITERFSRSCKLTLEYMSRRSNVPDASSNYHSSIIFDRCKRFQSAPNIELVLSCCLRVSEFV